MNLQERQDVTQDHNTLPTTIDTLNQEQLVKAINNFLKKNFKLFRRMHLL